MLSSGTSVDYNYIDFCFVNNTEQDFALFTWCENDYLFAELRCKKAVSYEYQLIEEDRHFCKEGDEYFCISKIYKLTICKDTHDVLEKRLVRDNHSKVMYEI